MKRSQRSPGRWPRKLTWPDSPLTQWKLLWRDVLPEKEKEYWRAQFASPRSLADIGREIFKKYKIQLNLRYHLTRFRQWLAQEAERLEEAEMAEADKAELERQGLKGEKLRRELLERMKRRALRRGDFKLGATAVNLDLKAEKLALEQKAFREGKRTKIQAGLEAILAEARGNPAIAAAVSEIQKATA
jgi:hypothetical protein